MSDETPAYRAVPGGIEVATGDGPTVFARPAAMPPTWCAARRAEIEAWVNNVDAAPPDPQPRGVAGVARVVEHIRLSGCSFTVTWKQ